MRMVPLCIAIAAAAGCAAHLPAQEPMVEAPAGTEELYVAGGCFWCVEAIFERYEGVVAALSGYAGGQVENPTYEQVCSGTSGHAEAVRLVFDPKKVSADELLKIFLTTHDPTQLNRQGPDVGTQYRSAIFYRSEAEKELAQRVIREVEAEKIWPGKIVTTVEPLGKFYVAEAYHQDYFDRYEKASPAERMRMNGGYCANVIEPKVRKFREKFASKLRKG